jgi:hypothetical protein
MSKIIVMFKELICRGSFEGGTSCHARRLLVCYDVTFISVTSDMFQPYKVMIRQILLCNCCTVLLFLVHCSKTWLKPVRVIV